MEDVTGGSGNDSLVGSNHQESYESRYSNRLEGWPGADVLVGGPGSDVQHGGEGWDTFLADAGTGRDSLQGGNGNAISSASTASRRTTRSTPAAGCSTRAQPTGTTRRRAARTPRPRGSSG